jgi:hypothetical protein
MMHRRGAAEIEFIMVLPILMLMFMGLVWAGRVSIGSWPRKIPSPGWSRVPISRLVSCMAGARQSHG